MSSKQISEPIIPHRPMTVAELQRAQASIREREITLTNEGHASYKAMMAGAPPSRPLNDHDRRVTAHIQLMMNGSTPSHLLTPAVSRDDQIRAELDAIRFVSRELAKLQADARLREADQLVSDNDKQWRALCREIILAATKLAALEERARDMLAPIHGEFVTGLAMGATIGSGLSLLGVGDPLAEMRNEALKDGVVTTAELRKAKHVE
jgi:hypothetical protein